MVTPEGRFHISFVKRTTSGGVRGGFFFKEKNTRKTPLVSAGKKPEVRKHRGALKTERSPRSNFPEGKTYFSTLFSFSFNRRSLWTGSFVQATIFFLSQFFLFGWEDELGFIECGARKCV